MSPVATLPPTTLPPTTLPPTTLPPTTLPPTTPPPTTPPPTLCLPASSAGLSCAFQAVQQRFAQGTAAGIFPAFPNGAPTDAASYAGYVSAQWAQALSQVTTSDLQQSCVPAVPPVASPAGGPAPGILPVSPAPGTSPTLAPMLAPMSAPAQPPAAANFPLGIYVQPPSVLPRDGFLVAVGHQNLTAPVDPMFAEICLSNFATQLQDGCANGGLRLSLPNSQTPLDAMNIALTLAKNAIPGDPANNQVAATALLVAYTRLIQGVGDPDCNRATLSQDLRDVLNQQNVVSLVQNNAPFFDPNVVTTFEDVLRSVTHSPPYSPCIK